MIEQVTLYKTTDGKSFADIKEAEAHQAGLQHAVLIDAYVAQAGELKKPQEKLLRKHLALFIVFDSTFEAPDADVPEAQAA